MTPLSIILLIALLCTVPIFIVLIKWHKVEDQEIEEANERRRKVLEQTTRDLEAETQKLTHAQSQYAAVLQQIQAAEEQKQESMNTIHLSYAALKSYQDNLEHSYQSADSEYDRVMQNLIAAYDRLQDSLIADTEVTKSMLQAEVNELKQKIEDYKKVMAAALEAKRREEQMQFQQDDYRIVLSTTELSTIALIEELKPRIPEPRILCMLIWTTFVQKKLKALSAKILGANTITGVYRITNIKTGDCYIGQAVDVSKRWSDHCKAGLGIDTPAANKLYQAMQKYGIDNFTFELIEQCDRTKLNEREKFYIDLYQSKDFGYNQTIGIR